MNHKNPIIDKFKLDKIVGGGQTLGTLDDGRKIFVWGGLPDEIVTVQVTKKKHNMVEGLVTDVLSPSANRISPQDTDSYLSTSPWQIMEFDSEQYYKSALIHEAFELHGVILPETIDVYTDNKQYEYRNKIEFSWYWNKDTEQLDLSFFRRGTHGKVPVDGTSLAQPNINQSAIALRNLIRTKPNIHAYDLKTLLVRCNQKGKVAMQLYVKNDNFPVLSDSEIDNLGITGFELIYSNPKSPASIVTKRLQSYGVNTLMDKILNIPFNYAIEGFFQINIPVYEQALIDMKKWINTDEKIIDLYSGVGSIGLTIGGNNVTMVEINEQAITEMKQNIIAQKREKSVKAILSRSENALEYVTNNSIIIVDPPRAGLHQNVISKLLASTPKRIVYLSCNPVTQARDISLLSSKYTIRYCRGYNFFPRTPHIEHLVILDKIE